MEPPFDSARWMAFFDRNRRCRPEPRWDAPISVPAEARPWLDRSLAEFQLGDGGGPASLIAWDVAQLRQRDPGMARAIDQWFEEEKEHSRLLGGLLRRLGVAPITGHWSFSLFCGVRRWLGVRFELQVLTLTELSSTAYYRLLRELGQDLALRDVCSLILRDESGHLLFQGARLRAAGAPWSRWRRWWWRAQFRACGLAAATVLWLSHGRCLRALGATRRRFFGEALRQFGRFLRRVDGLPADRAGRPQCVAPSATPDLREPTPSGRVA